LRITDRRTGRALRGRLRRLVWSSATLPRARPPTSYARDVRTALRRPLPGTRFVDRLVVQQDFGVNSVIELHRPAGAPRGFVIVHGGHGDVEDQLRPLMESLARSGYVVAVMNMPLLGWNPQPTVHTAGHGTLLLTSHNVLALLPGPAGRTLRWFLDPVIAAVDQGRAMGFESVDMIGLSGGGWTTTLSAALDRRIRRSFDVAGSLPIYLRSQPRDQGDFEQLLPSLYRLADYQDLYVLGALEPGRRHAQVFNDHDPCCFALRKAPRYVAGVRRALQRARGGTFGVLLSRNASHSLAERERAAILRVLAAP
jgi:dienelactone hydrolase